MVPRDPRFVFRVRLDHRRPDHRHRQTLVVRIAFELVSFLASRQRFAVKQIKAPVVY